MSNSAPDTLGAPRQAEFGWPGGDCPGAVEFTHPVADAVSQAILEPLRALDPRRFREGNLHALHPPDGVSGRFQWRTPTEALFLRVSARRGYPDLEQAITGYLQAGGLAVNHLEMAGLPVVFEGQEYRLDVRALLRATHPTGTLDELRSVAAALARCHEMLAKAPFADRIRQIAIARYTHLAEVLQHVQHSLEHRAYAGLCPSDEWLDANHDWLAEMCAAYDPRFDRLPDAQCLHGQVHRGNVMFTAESQAVLLDWEEAVHLFAPPAWDLAYFIQRFCLHDAPAPEVLRERLDVIQSAYGRPLTGIAAMLRRSAWYSMTILLDLHAQGIRNPISEYEKFVRLERQASALASSAIFVSDSGSSSTSVATACKAT